MSYIVQKGDTLAKIAARIYGEPSKWAEIADFTGIANPKLIYPGDVVYYQLTDRTQAFASGYEAVTRSEVRVMQGDTLSTIAGRVLGNSGNWKSIWRYNDNISNPDRLEVGSTIYYVEPGMLSASFEAAKDNRKFAEIDVETKNGLEELVTAVDSVDEADESNEGSEDFATINSVSFSAII